MRTIEFRLRHARAESYCLTDVTTVLKSPGSRGLSRVLKQASRANLLTLVTKILS
jgi:hypothetical protein